MNRTQNGQFAIWRRQKPARQRQLWPIAAGRRARPNALERFG